MRQNEIHERRNKAVQRHEGYGRQRQRENDFEKNVPVCRPIEEGRFLQTTRDRVEMTFHDPCPHRNGTAGIHENDAKMRVEHLRLQQQHENRHNGQEPREHLQHEQHHQALLSAGEPKPGEGVCRHRHQGRRQHRVRGGDLDRVAVPQHKIRIADQLGVMADRRICRKHAADQQRRAGIERRPDDPDDRVEDRTEQYHKNDINTDDDQLVIQLRHQTKSSSRVDFMRL